MGVFDFVKEAGAKIGIGETKDDVAAKAAAEAAAKAAEVQHASEERAAEVAKRIRERKLAETSATASAAAAERIEQLEESKRAAGLEQYITSLGFDVTNLDIRFDDGLATVSGQAADQATREKVILAIGNSAEVHQVQDQIEVPVNAEPESQLHVVVKGDTLSKIAKEVYGDAMKYPVIFEANRPMLSDPDKIYVGQVLRIPAI